jgi:hypothetical protein
MMEGKKDTDKWFPLRLLDSTDGKTGETAKAFGDVTVQYSFEAATSWSAYATDVNNWKETGNGGYWLSIGASEFTSEGKYMVKITCAGCLDVFLSIEVADRTQAENIDNVDSILVDTGTSIPNDISNLNDISSGDAQTACDAAITANGDINNIDTGVNNIEAKLPAGTISDFDETTDPVELLNSGGAAGTSAEELVDDVWDEATSGHIAVGSTGLAIGSGHQQ